MRVMRFVLSTLFATAALVALTAVPAFAGQPPSAMNHNDTVVRAKRSWSCE